MAVSTYVNQLVGSPVINDMLTPADAYRSLVPLYTHSAMRPGRHLTLAGIRQHMNLVKASIVGQYINLHYNDSCTHSTL